MSKRKGVSADEKRTRMLQLFYEKRDFFQLKELEKIAPKEKGIIAQSVKDVVQSLVDDGLVDSEKIGTSIYFWAYPTKAKQSRKRKLDELKNKHEENVKQMNKNMELIKKANDGREETEERIALLDNIQKLKSEKDQLKSEITKYQDSDPEILEKLENETKALKEAANRWTDNICLIKQYCKNKFMIEEHVLDKEFGINTDLEYL